MKKKIFIIITILLLFVPQVNAECDNDRLNEIKNLARNIEITYELDTELDKEKNYSVNDYGDELPEGNIKVIISGMFSGVKLIDETNNRTFYYTDVKNRLITLNKEVSGILNFRVYSTRCEKNIRSISLNIPKYNEYSTDPLCGGINAEELKICSMWYDKEIDYATFEKEVKKYKKRLADAQKLKEQEDKDIVKKVIKFVSDYYIYLIISTIIVIGAVIFFVIKRKRSVLE